MLKFYTAVWVLCVAMGTLPSPVQAENLAVPGGSLQLEWDTSFNEQEKAKLTRWIEKAAATVSQLNGAFPREEARVVINRARSRGGREPGAVPWGQTIRSGMQGVLFTVNPNRALDEFIGDWTAAHEFSHLFIPYPTRRDIWLSEGFASYYQNILMAREGIYSEQRAWQKLYEGFRRAERDTRYDNLDLSDLSAGIRENRSYMRIYWSGALFFLEADIRLRQASNNQKSLDWVLTEYVKCCRDNRNRWNGRQLMASFDEIVGNNLFSDLYQQYCDSSAIPDYVPLLGEIGIEIRRGEVQLMDDKREFREAFTQPRL